MASHPRIRPAHPSHRGHSKLLGPALVAALLGLGCDGRIADAEAETELPGLPEQEVPLEECATAAPNVGATPLRRLSQAQYRNTIEDVLGVELPDAAESRLVELVDGRGGGFVSTASAPDVQGLRGYLTIAELLAPAAYERLVECDPSERACAEGVLRNFARRMYRRAIEDDDMVSLMRVYDVTIEDGAQQALTTALTAVLASPHFLYHAEPVLEEATNGELVPVDAFALAGRLSFFFWNGPPDAELLDKAEAGVLNTDEGLQLEIARLQADGRAERQLETFYEQWFEVHKIDKVRQDDPNFGEVRAALAREPVAFVRAVMATDPTLAELMTADYTAGDEHLASIYGADVSEEGIIHVNRDERSGALTLPGILAGHGVTFPLVHRGFWVRNVLLCDPPPAPPDDVELDGTVDRLSTQPCVGCHLRMDPIGMGFAAFDDAGRFVSEAAQGGDVVSPGDSLDVAGAFESPRELGERMADSADVSDCFSKQWFRFAMGRADTRADSCGMRTVQQEFAASGGNLEQLPRLLGESVAFRSRSVAALEMEGR